MSGDPGSGACAGCGRAIPSHRMLCDDCRAGREVFDAGGMREGTPAAATEPAGPTPEILTRRFKPPGTLAIALRILFSALILVEGFALGALLVLEHMTTRLLENPLAYTLTDFRNQRQLAVTLGWVELAFMAVLAVLFIAWMFRASGNVPALVTSTSRYGRGWAIGGWFIPFVNLVVPKQIVDDLWRCSDPEADGRSYARWGTRPVHLAVHLWWATFLLSRVLFVIGNSSVDSVNPASARTGTRFVLAGTVLTIAAAALAVWTTATISRRQADRARASGRRIAERDAVRWLRSGLAAAGVAAVGMVAAGYLVFDPGESSRLIESTSESGAGRYDAFGIAFEYDGEYVAVASGIDGVGDPDEEGGIVLIGRPGTTESGLVMWVVPAVDAPDRMEAVDGFINAASQAFGTGPLIDRSDPLGPADGPPSFVARTFRVDGDLGIGHGAVAAGWCPVAGYLVLVAWLDEGSFQFADDPEDLEVLQRVRAILTTLDC